MKLIENYTPEELAARHIKVYNGGHHGASNTLSARIDALEDYNLPAINNVPIHVPVQVSQPTNLDLIDRINRLTAEVRFLEKKLNERLGKKVDPLKSIRDL
jgi:hypothetical protein